MRSFGGTTYQSAAVDVDGLAAGVNGAVAFTLAANDAGDGLAHLITIKNNSVTNYTGVNFTIVGLDSEGRPQSEVLAGPDNAATVTSVTYFSSVTSVTPSGSGIVDPDTIDIGWAAASVSPSIVLDRSMVPFGVTFHCDVVGGSPNYTMQYAFDAWGSWNDHATVAGETTSQTGEFTSMVERLRLKFTAAGSVRFFGLQEGAPIGALSR